MSSYMMNKQVAAMFYF